MSVIDAMRSILVRKRLDEVEEAVTTDHHSFAMSFREARILLRAYLRLAALREHPCFHSLVEEIRSHGYAVRDNPRAQAFRLLYEVMTEVEHPRIEAAKRSDSNTRLRVVK